MLFTQRPAPIMWDSDLAQSGGFLGRQCSVTAGPFTCHSLKTDRNRREVRSSPVTRFCERCSARLARTCTFNGCVRYRWTGFATSLLILLKAEYQTGDEQYTNALQMQKGSFKSNILGELSRPVIRWFGINSLRMVTELFE